MIELKKLEKKKLSDNYWKELKDAVKREGFDKVITKRSPVQTKAGKQDKIRDK